jgi:FTR1 family protein
MVAMSSSSRGMLRTIFVLSLFALAQSDQDSFNPAALLIVFREVLEGCIVISVMLNALHKIGAEKKKKWVWLGACAGLSVSIVVGIMFMAMFWAASQNLSSGNSKSIFQGVLASFGSLMVTAVSFKLLKFSGLEAKWEAKLRSRGAGATVNSDANCVAPTPEEIEEIAGSNTTVFLLIFSIVFREGLETAMFIGGVGAAVSWRSLPLPSFVGIVFGLLTGFAIVYGGRKAENMAWFFYLSCILMLFIAAGYTTLAAAELESIFTLDAQMSGSVIIGEPLWNLKYCCEESQVGLLQGFFDVMRGIVGWRDSPTYVMAVVYLSYWLVVTAVLWFKYETGTLFESEKWAKEPEVHVPFDQSLDAGKISSQSRSKIVLSSRCPDQPMQAELPEEAPAAPPSGEVAFGQKGSTLEINEPEERGESVTGRSRGAEDSDPADPVKDVQVVAGGEVADEAQLGLKQGLATPQAATGWFERAFGRWRWHMLFAAAQVTLWSFLIALSVIVGLRTAKGVRLYFVAVEDVDWDYAPTGRNGLTGRAFTDPAENDTALYMVRTERLLGSRVLKSRFVEYTDKSFSTVKAPAIQWLHTGILGPIIRAEVELSGLFPRSGCSAIFLRSCGVLSFVEPPVKIPLTRDRKSDISPVGRSATLSELSSRTRTLPTPTRSARAGSGTTRPTRAFGTRTARGGGGGCCSTRATRARWRPAATPAQASWTIRSR